jgi:prepilin-type N-terminal cleavage/methylation domain-containing protein
MEHRAPSVEGGSESGLTLIEIVISLVIVSILGAMLYSYFGTAITHSGDPIARMNSALGLQKVMENITADYMANYPSDLATLQTNVGDVGSSNPSYGSYTVVENHFITWGPSHNELTGGSKCLKVTVKNSLGETLTQIYTSGTQDVNCQ